MVVQVIESFQNKAKTKKENWRKTQNKAKQKKAKEGWKERQLIKLSSGIVNEGTD